MQKALLIVVTILFFGGLISGIYLASRSALVGYNAKASELSSYKYKRATYTCSDKFVGEYKTNLCLTKKQITINVSALCSNRKATLVTVNPDNSSLCRPKTERSFVVYVGDPTKDLDQKRMFIVKVSHPETISTIERCLKLWTKASRPCGKFITGMIQNGNGGFNHRWSWHLSPDSVRMTETATEVCDGKPQDVENAGSDFDSGRYCPWSSKIIAEGSTYPKVPKK